MTVKKPKKYLVRKVDEQGEDVKVDAATFDAALRKMITSKPLPFQVLASRPKPKKDGGAKRRRREGLYRKWANASASAAHLESPEALGARKFALLPKDSAKFVLADRRGRGRR